MNLIGTKITVMHRGQPLQATITALDSMENGFTYAFTHESGEATTAPDGFGFPEDEGVEWLAGWGEDAGAVLLAVQALRPEPELNFGTSTGRWQSQQPNIQNYPKPRGAGAARDYLLGKS